MKSPTPSRCVQEPVTEKAKSSVRGVVIDVAVHPAAGAGVELGATALFVAGLAGDDVDRAADRITSIQRALRAAQHFHALDVGQRPVLTDLAAEVDAVHVHADARVGGDQVVLQADAADKGVHRRGVAGGKTGDIQVGHELADIGQVGDALALDAGWVKAVIAMGTS